MSKLFAIEVDSHRAVARLDALPERMRARLRSVVEVWEVRLLRDVLVRAPYRTGIYAESIHGEVTGDQTYILGSVTAGGKQAFYARFLEDGANIPAHEIRPSTKKALHFTGSAGEVFARVVHSPGAHIAPRDVLQGAFAPVRAQIATEIRAAVMGAVTEEG